MAKGKVIIQATNNVLRGLIYAGFYPRESPARTLAEPTSENNQCRSLLQLTCIHILHVHM